MNPNLANKDSQIIEIEDDVIDLDEAEKTAEEVIYEWDAKIRKKLSTFGVADNERVLGDLMKDYLQSLQEMTRSYDDNETLKNKVFCHIHFLYSYYVELQCCTSDNYLSNMEDILTLYCNLELEAIRPLKKKDLSKHKYKKRIVSVARQIIHVLTVYLLERHDQILHVLIKMNTNKVSDSCSEMLNILYSHFLTKVPAFNLSDESFCRNYIVFQKWKEIRKVEDWEGMDKIMYKMFKRTPESIKNNETLRQILMPACSSTVDIVLNLFRSFRAISSAYFKHVLAKRNSEFDDLDFNIDLGEDEPTIAVDDEDEEEVQFLKAYYEVERNMTNLSHITNTSDISEIDIFRKCKEENDEDDDVQFVGITMLPKQPVVEISISNEGSDYRMSNISNKRHMEIGRIPVPTPPLLLNSPKEKNDEFENLNINGITRICVGSSKTVSELESPRTAPELESPRTSHPEPIRIEHPLLARSPKTVPELESSGTPHPELIRTEHPCPEISPRIIPELESPRASHTEPIRTEHPLPATSPRTIPELESTRTLHPEPIRTEHLLPAKSPRTIPELESSRASHPELVTTEHLLPAKSPRTVPELESSRVPHSELISTEHLLPAKSPRTIPELESSRTSYPEAIRTVHPFLANSPRTIPELESARTSHSEPISAEHPLLTISRRTIAELESPTPSQPEHMRTEYLLPAMSPRTIPELELARTAHSEPIRTEHPFPVVFPRTIPEIELWTPASQTESSRVVPFEVSPLILPTTSDSCQTMEVQTATDRSLVEEEVLCTIAKVTKSSDVTTETNQPEVSFDSNIMQLSSPFCPAKTVGTVCDSDDTHTKRTVELKSVEVQAGGIKNYLYNDYGLTTPPFDVQTDEQISRPVEPRLYTDIGHSRKKDLKEKENVNTRTVEVQVDPPIQKTCPYNDYGLTPPNDPHIEDHGTRLQEPLYTNIVHKDLSSRKDGTFDDPSHTGTHNNEISEVDQVAQKNIELETDSRVDGDYVIPNTETRNEIAANEATVADHESEFDEFEDQLDISEMTNVGADSDTEEIDVESCQEADKESPAQRNEGSNQEVPNSFENEENQNVDEEYNGFKKSDQIDTGQKVILKSAPNIEPVTADSELKDVGEVYNGSTVLKPLVCSNRTNGQAKDSTTTKIMYTSSQRIRPTLDEFSRFENAIHSQWNKTKENHDFDAILTGPVSKVLPVKQNSLFSSQDKLDLFSPESNSKAVHSNSRSNSPNDMTSPAYEAIDDFRNYFSDSVNGRVPPPHDVRVPRGILKKTKSTRKKNYRIMFHESTCDNEERKPRSDGVLVLKSVRMDEKLNMEPRVTLKRRRDIEKAMKMVLNNPPTLRVDYDKTTTHINDKDVVRCISPPRFSFIVQEPSSHNSGKVKPFNYSYGKKVPSKCEKNMSSCCNQLAEEFTKLNCSVVEDKALNLTIPEAPRPVDPESEFSNSPTFLPDELVQHCLEETASETPEVVERNSSLLCDNSNFYTSNTLTDNLTQSLSNIDAVKTDTIQSGNNNSNDNNAESGLNVSETLHTLLQLPTAVPETYDFEKNLKNEVFSKIDWQNLDDSDGETRLPLKKRKLSVTNKNENVTEEQKKEEISYPATPMISIAEVEAFNPPRAFKTAAERKEMPPEPAVCHIDPNINHITADHPNINNHTCQNHTYHNPTINYHVNNLPLWSLPCGSCYSLSHIFVPLNSVSSFEQNKLNTQQEENYGRKENRKQRRQRKRQ